MNEYLSKAIPPGSSLYYSLRFIPQLQRYPIGCLYAFSHEIETIVGQCRTPEIAQRKLAWWQQELSNLTTAQAKHPLSQALQPLLQQYAISPTVLTGILSGIAKRLANPSYADFTAFSEQHYRAISSFPLLVTLITIPATEPRPLAFVHDLGIALQTVETIHDLRRDLQHGYIYLPEQALMAFGIDEQQLLHLKPSHDLSQLLQQLAAQARSCYQQALTKIEPKQKSSQLASLILAKLYFKLLDELEQDNFQVLTKQIVLPPLRKLWLAWLCTIN